MFSGGASRKFLKKANFGKTVDIGGVSIGIIFLPTFQVHNDDRQKLAKTHGLLTVIIARLEGLRKDYPMPPRTPLRTCTMMTV